MSDNPIRHAIEGLGAILEQAAFRTGTRADWPALLRKGKLMLDALPPSGPVTPNDDGFERHRLKLMVILVSIELGLKSDQIPPGDSPKFVELHRRLKAMMVAGAPLGAVNEISTMAVAYLAQTGGQAPHGLVQRHGETLQ